NELTIGREREVIQAGLPIATGQLPAERQLALAAAGHVPKLNRPAPVRRRQRLSVRRERQVLAGSLSEGDIECGDLWPGGHLPQPDVQIAVARRGEQGPVGCRRKCGYSFVPASELAVYCRGGNVPDSEQAVVAARNQTVLAGEDQTGHAATLRV